MDFRKNTELLFTFHPSVRGSQMRHLNFSQLFDDIDRERTIYFWKSFGRSLLITLMLIISSHGLCLRFMTFLTMANEMIIKKINRESTLNTWSCYDSYQCKKYKRNAAAKCTSACPTQIWCWGWHNYLSLANFFHHASDRSPWKIWLLIIFVNRLHVERSEVTFRKESLSHSLLQSEAQCRW